MPWQWKPEEFLAYRGVRIFHAYKDEYSDIPLEFWYSTSSTGAPGSPHEFDVRDLPGYRGRTPEQELSKHQRVIRAAIDAGILSIDAALTVNQNA
jgi:hypothetical protein